MTTPATAFVPKMEDCEPRRISTRRTAAGRRLSKPLNWPLVLVGSLTAMPSI
jgi:hypothetical protein